MNKYQLATLKNHVVALKLDEVRGIKSLHKTKLLNCLKNSGERELYEYISGLSTDELLTLILNEVLR